MTQYKIAQTHDILFANLNIITPQPRAEAAAPVVRNYSIDGTVHQQSLYVCLHWDFINSPEEYLSLLQLFGLDNVGDDSAPVTIYCRTERYEWNRYNGIAHAPEPGVDVKWEGFFIKDLKIYVTDLEAL